MSVSKFCGARKPGQLQHMLSTENTAKELLWDLSEKPEICCRNGSLQGSNWEFQWRTELWASSWTWGAASSGSEQMTSRGLFNVCSFVVPHTTVSFSLSQLCCEQTCSPVQISVDCRQMLQNCSCEWRKGAFQKHCTFWKVDSSLGLGPYLRLLGQNVQVKKIIFITYCH